MADKAKNKNSKPVKNQSGKPKKANTKRIYFKEKGLDQRSGRIILTFCQIFLSVSLKSVNIGKIGRKGFPGLSTQKLPFSFIMVSF